MRGMGSQSRRAVCLDGTGVPLSNGRNDASERFPSGQHRPLPASHLHNPKTEKRCGGVRMLDTEAFREFKQGLALLRDDYALKALPHMRRAAELDKNNPYYMSYLGVVLARSEEKWGEAEKLCDAAVRMKRNQAQLYLNLAEVYSTAGRREDAVETLQAGLKFARRDVRLNLALNRLITRRAPVFTFLSRRHPLNRKIGRAS